MGKQSHYCMAMKRILYMLTMAGADSGFEIRGRYNFHGCRGVWGHAAQGKF